MLGFNVGQVLVGIVIAFIYGWKLTLVLIAMSPLFALGGVAEQKSLQGNVSSKQDTVTLATQVRGKHSQVYRGAKIGALRLRWSARVTSVPCWPLCRANSK